MSLIPHYLRQLRQLRRLGYYDNPARLFNEDLFAPFTRDPFFRDPFKYIQNNFQTHDLAESEMKIDGKKVEVHLDVRNFTPEQIKVKTIGDEVIVEGQREVKEGDGWTRSHFERRFVLPEGFPPERVECRLDAGKLRLLAFREQPLPEREVPIKNVDPEHSRIEEKKTSGE